MPNTGIWLHVVFNTKQRQPFLHASFRWKVFQRMLEDARANDIWLDHVNGHNDHCHCLILLKPTQSLSWVVKQIKGASSKWISETYRLPTFEWQAGYYAISLSRNHLNNVRSYISKQEQHHRNKTSIEELTDWLSEHGLEKSRDDDELDET